MKKITNSFLKIFSRGKCLSTMSESEKWKIPNFTQRAIFRINYHQNGRISSNDELANLPIQPRYETPVQYNGKKYFSL